MWHEKPRPYGRGYLSYSLFLSDHLIRDTVSSKIGELLGEKDRSRIAAAYFCDFRFCQIACACTGKNSIILFGHNLRQLKRFNRSPMPGRMKL